MKKRSPQTKYKIKDLPSEQQPREKLVDKGPDSLSNAELLAILFVTGTREEGVLELASRVIKEYGSRSITEVRDVDKVIDMVGLGQAKACQLVACFELGRRFFKEESGRMPTIRGPEDAFKLLANMQSLKREELRGLYLNTRQKVMYEEVIAVGSLNVSRIPIRDILQPAVELMAAAFILVHNHPSGDPSPSKDDVDYSCEIKKAANLLGIEFLDHIVVGKGDFVSLDGEGYL